MLVTFFFSSVESSSPAPFMLVGGGGGGLKLLVKHCYNFSVFDILLKKKKLTIFLFKSDALGKESHCIWPFAFPS